MPFVICITLIIATTFLIVSLMKFYILVRPRRIFSDISEAGAFKRYLLHIGYKGISYILVSYILVTNLTKVLGTKLCSNTTNTEL